MATTPGGGFDPAAGGPGAGGPTLPPPPGPSGPGGPTNVGLAANVAAALCYLWPLCCLNVVWAVYVVVVEKQSRFLRFHAFQSLLFLGAMIVGGIVVQIVNIISGVLGALLSVLLLVIALVGALFLAFKAYSNEEFEIPTLGAFARQWS